jgi:hypothetical protein
VCRDEIEKKKQELRRLVGYDAALVHAVSAAVLFLA